MIHWPTSSSKREPRDRRATTPAFSRLLHAAIDAPTGPAGRRSRKRQTPQQPQNA